MIKRKIKSKIKSILECNRIKGDKKSDICLLVIWAYEARLFHYYSHYPKFLNMILESYKHVIIDTTCMKNKTINIEKLVNKHFSKNKPLVLFPSGIWLGNNGNVLTCCDDYEKILDIEDQKVSKQFNEMIVPNGIQNFMYRYDSQEMAELKRKTFPLGVRSFHWPHFTDGRVFRNRFLEKKYDICFYGAYNPNTYPFRHRIRRILEKNRSNFKIRFINDTENISGEQLSRELGKSWLAVATTVGIHDRLVNKYQEIAFSGCSILGNYPSKHRDELKEYCTEITEDMSDEEIVYSISRVLSDKIVLQDKINKLENEFRRRYRIEVGVKRFHNIINKIAHG